MEDIYGAVGASPAFTAAFAAALKALWADGTETTLKRYLGTDR